MPVAVCFHQDVGEVALACFVDEGTANQPPQPAPLVIAPYRNTHKPHCLRLAGFVNQCATGNDLAVFGRLYHHKVSTLGDIVGLNIV